MRRAEATLQVVLDMILEGLLIALLVFTPFAFGTVHTWAVSLAQGALAALFGLWLCRVIWTRPPSRPAQVPSTDEGMVSLAGYPFRRTRMGAPAALFAGLAALQLVPLPPAVLRALSPATAELYERSLPGYSQGEAIDFGRWEPWLTGADTGTAARLAQAAEPIPVEPRLVWPASLPLSLYPHETAGRLIMLLALCMAFAVVANALREPRQVERVGWVVVLAGLAMSVLGMVQQLQWNGRLYGIYPVPDGASPFGPFFNHNHFAAYLEMALPLALGLFAGCLARLAPAGFAADREAREGAAVAGPAARWKAALARHGAEAVARLGLSGFAFLVMLTALVAAGSRGAILSLAGATLVYGALLAGRGRIGRTEAAAGACLLAAAAIILAAVVPDHAGRMARKLEAVAEFETEPSLAARLVGWKATLAIAADFPVLGAGLGTFADAWLRHYPAGTANVWKEAHNDYLQIAAETGMAGALLVAWGLAVFLGRHVLRPGRGGRSHLGHGMAVGVLSILLHSAVDFSLQVGAIALLFTVLSAFLAGGAVDAEGA